MQYIKKIVIYISFTIVVLLMFSSCGNRDNTGQYSDNIINSDSDMIQEIDDSAEIDNSYSSNTIIWGVSSDYLEMSNVQENLSYFNSYLKTINACNGYSLEFKAIDSSDYSNSAISALQDGEVDIINVGTGEINVFDSDAQRILESDLLFDLTRLLYTANGQKLVNSITPQRWTGTEMNGKQYVIPNQMGVSGTAYMAFRSEWIDENEIEKMNLYESLLFLENNLVDNQFILWGTGGDLEIFAPTIGYEYVNGVYVNVETGECKVPFDIDEVRDFYELLNRLHESGKIFDKTYFMEQDIPIDYDNCAAILESSWGSERNELSENYFFIQLPFYQKGTINAGNGISATSSKKEEALELLSLLYTDTSAADALVYGSAKDLSQGSYIHSIYLGIYDALSKNDEMDFSDDLSSNKNEVIISDKGNLSYTAGAYIDTDDWSDEMKNVPWLISDMDQIWRSNNFESDYQNGVDIIHASDSDLLMDDLETQYRNSHMIN